MNTDTKALWDKAKNKDADINGGGMGRLRIRGDKRVFVGALFLNVIMLFDGKQGYLQYGTTKALYPSDKITLTPDEFVEFINK